MKNLLISIATILMSINLSAQSCLPDGIDFTTQAQIDNFQSNYPGCTEVEGNVEIGGEDITNVNGLSGLTSIGGSFYISNNVDLYDLTGLASLTSVGGSFLVSTNPDLASLAGLENLVYVEEDVFISNNAILSDISAIGGIDAAAVAELWITNNISLATCDIPFICNFLAVAYGKIRIYGNAPGCSSPPEIADGCGITLPCLPFGDYYFKTQGEVDNFQENYPGCTDLQGVVHIQGADITNLAGLNVINTINGPLEITQNPLLTNLSGLDSIIAIGGPLTIVGNSLLTDISSVNNIDTGSITFLGINNNPLLSECDIPLICDFLSGPYGSSHQNITNNADGCKNKDEVLQACFVGEKEIPGENNLFRISPNPAFNHISVNILLKPAEYQISIFNYNGQELFRQWVSESVVEIDISDFPPGLYFVRLEYDAKLSTGKFIKLD
jgi:hypothetical protein